jgi:hypothetical protein
MALARVLLLRSRHEKGGLVSTFKHTLVPTDFGESGAEDRSRGRKYVGPGIRSI